MYSVNISPAKSNLPQRGGVREHMVQLYKQLERNDKTLEVVLDGSATLYHVESSYRSPSTKADAYVCHGGFLPAVIPQVTRNLRDAKVIITVAQWMVSRFFKQLAHKTIHIPNGVDLEEWSNVPSSPLEPGHVLYAKEWPYFISPLLQAVSTMPETPFVTTVWPDGLLIPSNVQVIGLQTREGIKSYLKDAGCLLLTGDEVCPTMLLEAWAVKTPVVAFYTPSARTGSAEIMLRSGWQEPIGGSLFFDDESLVTRIAHVLENSMEMGNQGFEVVKAKYQWKYLFEQYLQVYESIVNNDLETLWQKTLT